MPMNLSWILGSGVPQILFPMTSSLACWDMAVMVECAVGKGAGLSF